MKRCPTNKTKNAYMDKYAVQRKDNDVFCKKICFDRDLLLSGIEYVLFI